MHEMNGSWGYPWQETQNGNKRGEFVQAWRHIVDIFRPVGVQQRLLRLVPQHRLPEHDQPDASPRCIRATAYVDWTCLDGYNWGTNRSSGWQTFDQVYNYSYNEILKFAPAKPMMIGEFGSVEQGGSKASWLTDALKTQIPGKYTQRSGPRSTSTGSSTASTGESRRLTSAQDAWKKGIASSYYAPNQFGSITGKVAVP